jgi:CDGSH-type Zn-finger protein
MSRLVRHEAKGPAIVELGPGKVIGICQCGLSLGLPFCDGSHKATRDEQEHRIYVYDAERHRVAVPESYPPPAKKLLPA